MTLIEEDLPIDFDATLPAEIATLIESANTRIQTFQDRWDRRPIEQFVASDFALVYHSIAAVRERHLVSGNRFCEWGCGFAVVSCLADRLGWDTIGIEAEEVLIDEAKRLVQELGASVELWHGNILPPGADDLAYDGTLPSLGHPEPCIYDDIGLDIDDFDLIFAYPWPGEGDFLESVFERHARPGACFLTFCGPYEMRLVRKAR